MSILKNLFNMNNFLRFIHLRGFTTRAVSLLIGSLLLLNIPSSVEKEADDRLMVCYYVPSIHFPIQYVPANLCTHIIYANANVTPHGIVPQFKQDPEHYKAVVALKKQNPKLKVTLSLARGFVDVVDFCTKDSVEKFAVPAIAFLKMYGFDGADLDWEYPNLWEKEYFELFIKIFSSHLKNASMLLSVALPNNPELYQRGFDNQTLSIYMDFVTAMMYDFNIFSPTEGNTTDYNSPLFTPKGDQPNRSVAAMMTYYLKSGLPPKKLLMGLPLYGRSYTLAHSDQHGLHAPAVGVGGPAPVTGDIGYYDYTDSCVALQQGSTLIQDRINGAAYHYHNKTWVGFDNIETIVAKMTYMKAHGFGGVGIWAMDSDDCLGICNNGSLPLLKTIKSNL